MKTSEPKKGDPPNVFQDGKLTYIVWQDRRQVRVLTTVHNGSTFEKKVRSKFHDGNARRVNHPKAIQLYTQYMGGVDLCDQQMSYNMNQHRCLKWWKKLVLCNLLEITFANSKVIWKAMNPRAGQHCKSDRFRLSVIHGLLEGYARSRPSFRRPALDPPARLLERHRPGANPSMTPAGRRSSRDCVVCSDRSKKRCETQWWCVECRKPMCGEPCWGRYHSLVDYRIQCTADLHQLGNKTTRKK